jgi:iron-sulfur cluster repair protein YtfE (RIC family)
MSALTEALVAEHVAFSRRIDELRRLADDIEDEGITGVLHELDSLLSFLEHELLPHAAAEDAVLYPAVAAALGSPDATATMTRDHVAIRHLVAELRRHRDELTSAVTAAARFEVRRVLYALHAVIELHVAKEEELYVPVLDRTLTDDDAVALLGRMHAVAAAA